MITHQAGINPVFALKPIVSAMTRSSAVLIPYLKALVSASKAVGVKNYRIFLDPLSRERQFELKFGILRVHQKNDAFS
jgi:hypothetical protein